MAVLVCNGGHLGCLVLVFEEPEHLMLTMSSCHRVFLTMSSTVFVDTLVGWSTVFVDVGTTLFCSLGMGDWSGGFWALGGVRGTIQIWIPGSDEGVP